MKKILVVDDEENIRFLYKEELEDEGFVVELAKSGEEALEKLSLFRPDLDHPRHQDAGDGRHRGPEDESGRSNGTSRSSSVPPMAITSRT